MSSFILPSQLLFAQRTQNSLVSLDETQSTTWAEWKQRTISLIAQLNTQPEQKWMLYASDVTNFSIGFIGLLYAGKTIILPPNMQKGTLHSLSSQAEGALTDTDLKVDAWKSLSLLSSTPAIPNERTSKITLSPPNKDSSIALFTSGSTGEAKCVPKTLAHLEAELVTLEQMWGPSVENSIVFSTVSHQHIYGLLFRVLWPLSGGRPFWSSNFFNPSALFQAIQKPSIPKSTIVSTPAQLKRMLEWVSLEELHQTQPKMALTFSSGGPLAIDTAHGLEAGLGAPPVEVLGSSETGGVAWRQQSQRDPKVRWRPLDQVEVNIDKTEQTLMVRSPFTPVGIEQWYTMSDRAELNDDGSFELKGRKDRIVKIAEKRVSLAELEHRLNALEWVKESIVIVLPGRRQILGAILILSDGGEKQLETLGKHALNQKLRRLLHPYFEGVALPKRWRYLSEFPEDAQGKRPLQRLLALFQKEIC